mmetsp:Transcript_18861/g.32756  ORF Transcript_18861/g.32756 Transcript_18861/m.32756 type:complete len:3096 (+) Transcript_18861:58-9345(+)
MELVFSNSSGIPEGSILSVTAGDQRKQRLLNGSSNEKPWHFPARPLQANPFRLDVYAPIGTSRLALKPSDQSYNVELKLVNGATEAIKLDFAVKELAVADVDSPVVTPNGNGSEKSESRQVRKQKAATEAQMYIEKHQLMQYVQNMMQSVLTEKPDDPFEYMENILRQTRAKNKVELGPQKAEPKKEGPSKPRKVRPPKEKLKPIQKDVMGAAWVKWSRSQNVETKRMCAPSDVMQPGSQIRRLKIHHLSETFPGRNVESVFKEVTDNWQDDRSWVTQVLQTQGKPTCYYQMLAAGPRQYLHFDPKEVVATIVSCGGLAPGLNAVIRELVMLLYSYGVKKVWGVIGGFGGMCEPEKWIELTPDLVQDIHTLGGTILVSDRGIATEAQQLESLKAMNVRAHFILGGDGTHRGALDMYDLMQKEQYECAVIGIPKTVDNNIPMLDRTFGFDTACAEAEKALNAAYVEATGNANSIGLVKLMGRDCGFITMDACLASRQVDVCLLPEMNICLDKVLQHVIYLMQTKGHCVMVVSEGCYQSFDVRPESSISKAGGTFSRQASLRGSAIDFDAFGNQRLIPDVGPWLKEKILEKFREVELPLTIKYIDPTYMIRAVKPNANDSVYCAVIAQNAVHAALAGFTGISLGRVQMNFVMLPMQAVALQEGSKVDLKGATYQNLVGMTLQPDFTPDEVLRRQQLDGEAEYEKPNPLEDISMTVELKSVLGPNDEVRRLELDHLKYHFGAQEHRTTLKETVTGGDLGFVENGDAWVTQTMKMGSGGDKGKVVLQMVRAGPTKVLYHDPNEVAAAIITCGGLCPGLNVVIREVVMTLYAYGVKKVYGIKGGYKGVVTPQTWVTLTPEVVEDIHDLGGTILVTDRGNPTEEEQAPFLIQKGIKTYFIIGGDGTHLGAMDMYELLRDQGYCCSVIGIPKSIDNDIALLDRTFGFDTAMTEAGNAIDTAYVESKCNANCIGLVKLMGRHCGLLTMMSVVAARHVDICLIPEMNVSLTKVLDECVNLLDDKGCGVVVVAEGCAESLMKGIEVNEYDAGGNKKIPDVGIWLKDTILAHFKAQKKPLTIKYVDPTYMVRAVKSNANDSIYSAGLAHHAVHAAMSGFSGVTVARMDEQFVYLPIKVLCSQPSKTVDLTGRWFERLLLSTHQPNFDPGSADVKGRIRSRKPPQAMPYLAADGKADVLWVPDTKLSFYDGYGKLIQQRALERGDLLRTMDDIRDLKCQHLGETYGVQKIPTTLKTPSNCIPQDEYSWVTQAFHGAGGDALGGAHYYRMVRAGPRKVLHFDPHDPASSAAIVSCGGICPGLNCVIRELVMTLWAYGVRKIWGVVGGYKGVMEPENWLVLNPDMVQDIHMDGGTMLISDRGNPPHIEMAKVLKRMNVRQYFVLGGDGSHKGAMQTFDEMPGINHECSVVGVPKTIDNDVPLLDQTFGFDTACTEAVRSLDSAYVEARCNTNCIGLVKLMGRHCGFIAMNATLAARHVDICLLPEMKIDTEKVLNHAAHVMNTKGYCVIVVAEGCGDTMIKSDESQKDAGGNKILRDVGPWLQKQIQGFFKEQGKKVAVRYIDPTYMIRSIPANAYDNAYCSALAQNAVHGAMAGYTGITVGKIYERHVYLPIHAITKQPGRRVNTSGRWFHRLLETTGQPDLKPEGGRGETAMPCNSIMTELSGPSSINNVLQMGDEIRRLELVNLKDMFPSAEMKSPLWLDKNDARMFVQNDAWHTQTFSRKDRHDDTGHTYYQTLSGGPRETLFSNPAKGKAVIVTCGGLCPGLNSVIRELVNTLINYGVPKIYGCIGGYKSMVTPEKWIELTAETVQNIHKQGGTILVSDRGNPPHPEIAASLKKMGITNYFVIGGDGTHAGAMDSFTETQKLGYPCTVVGVPKTIDNDIVVLDRTFGFNTACTEAVKAINSAYVEVACGVGCCGLVRLMGRSCGFIAMEAVLAARHVDICLIPEMDISLPKLLTYATEVMDRKGYAMIIVAEGCGDTLIKSSGDTDAGGNKKLADVGPWLKEQLEAHFAKMVRPYKVKYTDPTYTIRAVPANANDAVYCSVLAQHAVHGAMAGYSGITVGKVDERYVMIPIHAIARKSRKIPLNGRHFERLMTTTGQINLAPGRGDEWKLMPPYPNADPYKLMPWEPLPDYLDKIWWKGIPAHKPFEKVSPRELAAPPGVTFKVFSGRGELETERELQPDDVFEEEADLRRVHVMKLSDRFGVKDYPSPLKGRVEFYYDDSSWSIESPCTTGQPQLAADDPYLQVMRAGPREQLHFDPTDKNLTAAIVTSGSLCPGENVAVREICMTLFKHYGVSRVFGVTGGFHGITDASGWQLLTEARVMDIHNDGGTILRSTPGHPPPLEAAKALQEKEVSLFFVLGGDGSHKYMQHLQAALVEIDYECACMGVPATIDNDIPKADSCFGFDTAISEAKVSVDAAYVEATCNANCIGLVKLAGHRSGNLALMVALATCRVDMCLLPEMEIKLDKVLEHCEAIMEKKRFAVIVVSEGCNASFLGNTPDEPEFNVGPWLRDNILGYFKSKKKPLTIKYIDPVTMIQTVKANAADSVYSHAVAENAVHGAMAGFTGVTSVKRNGRYIYMPVEVVSRCPPKRVNLKGNWFGRMLFATGQPDFSREKFSKRVSVMSPVQDMMPSGPDLNDLTEKIELPEVLGSGAEVHRLEVIKLFKNWEDKDVENPTMKAGLVMIKEDSYIMQALQRSNKNDKCDRKYVQLLRSGPRYNLHLDPKTPGSCAAIVTAGGLCPGLNTVIREVVRMLFAYGVEKVWGIRGGYKGAVLDDTWIPLTPDYIESIHMQGGTVLVSDRGNPPHIDIANALKRRNVRWYFVLGGDGTHKGATQTYDELPGIGHECAVCGVPKTIDNDIQMIDQTFGFDTAVTEAERAIDSGHVEATTNANCIGLVKLMGRHCGWVAATATLAARHVDICLIPEMTISLDKVLEHVVTVMKRKKYMVIVVAEGCGDTLLEAGGATDAGGNKILPDVGPWLKDAILAHCKKEAVAITIKYIDPTYMIRSVAANAFDNMYCSVLAQEAVHGAMAGYTCFTVGKVDEVYSMIPIHAICGKGQRKMPINSRVFARLMATTQQPSFAPS